MRREGEGEEGEEEGEGGEGGEEGGEGGEEGEEEEEGGEEEGYYDDILFPTLPIFLYKRVGAFSSYFSLPLGSLRVWCNRFAASNLIEISTRY